MQLLVVKRGRLSTFKMLSEQFAGVPDVYVIWERRAGVDRRERSGTLVPERRQRDRRQPHDLSGPATEYVIITLPDPHEASGGRTLEE